MFKKRLFFIICFFVMCVSGAFAQKHDIEFLSENRDEGTMQLQVTIYDVKQKYAIAEAESLSGEYIIFNAVEGSRMRRVPMVFDEDKAWKEHGAYLERLLNRGDIEKFILGSTIAEKGKVKGSKFYVVVINFNVNALKQDLENHQTTRKFGL